MTNHPRGLRSRRSTPSAEQPAPRLSVWATGQADSATQLRDVRCVPGTEADRDRIPPAIAARVIAAYTRPGDLVVDPDCGTGTVLVPALRAGRHALGLTTRPRWWATARANVTAAKGDGAWPDGSVVEASPHLLASAVAAGLVGRVRLVVTALREPTLGQARSAPGTVAEFPALTRIMRYCEPLLRTGGRLVVVARPGRHPDGSLLDTTTGLIRAGWSAGLVPVERCVALTAGLRGSRVVPQASTAERRRMARARRAGAPIALVAHHEAVVFRLAHEVELVAQLTSTNATPQPATRRHAHTPTVHPRTTATTANLAPTSRGGRRAA